jgi:CBS domain containing-hemolysin-like protein
MAVAWAAFLAIEFFVTRPLAEALAERFLLSAWPALEIVGFVGAPFARLQCGVERVLHRWFGREESQGAIQEELISVVNEGLREGAIKLENAEEMIGGLIDLHNLRVSEIMTPRTQMIMLSADETVEDARRSICEQNHSRVPVYGDSRDEIVGVLFAKDLLPHLASAAAPDRPLASLALRQPIYVPESQPVDVLLKDFQRGHMHMAIVLDEFGGVAGVVTMEDILEEVVGEIGDEYDERESPHLLREAENVWSVAGKTRIADLNAELPVAIPENGDYETLAGFLFHTLGRVPAVGDEVRQGDAVFAVTAVDKRAVERVRIALPAAEPLEAKSVVGAENAAT